VVYNPSAAVRFGSRPSTARAIAIKSIRFEQLEVTQPELGTRIATFCESVSGLSWSCTEQDQDMSQLTAPPTQVDRLPIVDRPV
jgi:hypothetical protein